jgi:hypothetical protein
MGIKVSEKEVLSSVWAYLQATGHRLFRNTCGAVKMGNRFIKYGVASPGGSDLIGWKSVTITPEMVGTQIAVFMAVECKASQGGKLSIHQKAFLDDVTKSGGFAIVATSIDDVKKPPNI